MLQKVTFVFVIGKKKKKKLRNYNQNKFANISTNFYRLSTKWLKPLRKNSSLAQITRTGVNDFFNFLFIVKFLFGVISLRLTKQIMYQIGIIEWMVCYFSQGISKIVRLLWTICGCMLTRKKIISLLWPFPSSMIGLIFRYSFRFIFS